ncbi:MAG TPA: hypothetical protein DCY89_02000 [Gammaproteobacteria bacterium]|nr:hypothetical protein [Gammaproteobacteria bacterium]
MDIQQPPLTHSVTLSTGQGGSELVWVESPLLANREGRILVGGTVTVTDVAEVPLPAALPLFVAGLSVVAAAGRRGRHSSVPVLGSQRLDPQVQRAARQGA